MRSRNCLPRPCPQPIQSYPAPMPALADEYGAAGIFGDVTSYSSAHPIGTAASPGRVLPGQMTGSDLAFARIPPAMMIQRCPPSRERPSCPRPIMPVPAGENGLPLLPTPGTDMMPVQPRPMPIAPRPTRPPYAMQPLPLRPQIMPGPRPVPILPPAFLGPPPKKPLRPRPRTPAPLPVIPVSPSGPITVQDRPVPLRPQLYARPTAPTLSFKPKLMARGSKDLYTTINGFGAVESHVNVYGGGVFEALPYSRPSTAVMVPTPCRRPMPSVETQCGPGYPAPVVAMPSSPTRCPQPVSPCAPVPGYDVVVPPPSSGCSGFGWW